MAKCSPVVLASTLCFLSLLVLAHSEDAKNKFTVEGTVYCDTCRAQFITRVTQYLKAAKVRLECRESEGGKVTYSREAETDATGSYKMEVDGDHEEEVCEIVLVKSSNDDCNEISKDDYNKKAARVSLTSNDGITSPVRIANPLGFLRKDPLPECKNVFKELGISAEDLGLL